MSTRYRRLLLLAIPAALIAASCLPPSLSAPPAAPGGSEAASAVVSLPGQADQPFDFPDPSVIQVDGVYYGYATGSSTFGFSTVPVVRSTDLQHWTYAGEGLPGGTNGWADLFAFTWAPSVTQHGNNFLMYYAARDRASGRQCVGVATSTTGPEGPFADASNAPLVCQHDRGGTIDPDAFVDDGGQRFLLFKSEGTPQEPTRIWSAALAADGLSLVGAAHELLVTSYSWEQPIIEAPALLHDEHGYTLFYSASDWASPGYTVGAARCDGPLGPCSRIYGTPLVAGRGSMVGSGGASLVSEANAGPTLAFHAWTSPAVGYDHPSGEGRRSLRFLPVTWQNGLPVVG